MSGAERFEPADLLASGLFDPEDVEPAALEELLASLKVLDDLARAIYPDGDFGRGRTTWKGPRSERQTEEPPDVVRDHLHAGLQAWTARPEDDVSLLVARFEPTE